MTSLAGICGPLAVGQSPRPILPSKCTVIQYVWFKGRESERSASLTGHEPEAGLACREMIDDLRSSLVSVATLRIANAF
jgi:hypothetical protein